MSRVLKVWLIRLISALGPSGLEIDGKKPSQLFMKFSKWIQSKKTALWNKVDYP